MVDFRNIIYSTDNKKITDPVTLYQTLDRLSTTGTLRPVQEYVLNEWYSNRKEEKDIIVKLHTGEGKTLVGLLMLQSIINQGDGPCVYVSSNIFLANQVCEEAKKFGISFCTIDEDNQIPNEFLRGQKILITYAHKIFNGRTIFGLKNRSIDVNTILLDDAHACNDVIKKAFTISIDRIRDEHTYISLLSLFAKDLKEQGEGSYLEIVSKKNEDFMYVPYWSWNENLSQVIKAISKISDEDHIKFVWPLIKDKMDEMACFFSASRIEIRPYNINANVFGTFSRAKRRILMSATTQEDVFFIKGLEFSTEAVSHPIVNPSSKWSGEKMILLPGVISKECERDYVAAELCKRATAEGGIGVVAITPSTNRTNYYLNNGAVSYSNNDELENLIKNIKEKNLNKLLVLNNRYDGVDLPDESCRVLILDSLPHSDSYFDRYEEKCCPNRDIINKRIAQKIEQGLGRAVRGEKDYCAVIVNGNDITNFMYNTNTRSYFSQQTQKQIDIGFEVSNMAKKDVVLGQPPIDPVIVLILQMLQRDIGWKEFYKREMDSIGNSVLNSHIYEKYVAETELEKLYAESNYKAAADKTQEFIDKYITDRSERGWFLQQKARYTYKLSSDDAEFLQKQAFKYNDQLLKPRENLYLHKKTAINGVRVAKIRENIKSCKSKENLNFQITNILNDLKFGIEAKRFEGALQRIGEFLGFESTRPDNELGKGPDNLWKENHKDYIMFECKNEVKESRKEISKTETGQYNNHLAWFKSTYGEGVNTLCIMIIPTARLSNQGDFADKVYAMNLNGLNKFTDNVKRFFQEIMNYDIDSITDSQIQNLINQYKLNSSDFINEYLSKIKQV